MRDEITKPIGIPRCATEGCSCPIGMKAPDGSRYCSSDCSMGRGCSCESCQCGDRTTKRDTERLP